jgi:hypothetical protein
MISTGRTRVARVRWSRILLILVGSGLVVACSAPSSSSPPLGSATATASLQATEASPSGSVTPLTPIGDLTPFAGGVVSAVGTFRNLLVAVGEVPHAPGTGAADWMTDAATWTSPDGLSWTRASAEPSFSLAGMTNLAVSATRIVVVGYPATAHGLAGFRIWTSADGQAWTVATNTPGFDPTVVSPGPVTLFRSGFVTVGGDISAGFPAVPVDALVLTSTDGSVWSIVSANPSFKTSIMGGVAANGALLVAVGSGKSVAKVWTSSDGRAWTAVANNGMSPTAEVNDVAAGGPGFIAVGKDGSRAVAWTSVDGQAWLEEPAAPSLAGASMSSIVRTTDGFLALGTASDGSGILWSSNDGVTWTRLDLGAAFAGGQVTAANRIGDRVVVFGTSQQSKLVAATGPQ